MELYQNMGFKRNPFSRFSAEEEKEYLHKIYLKPRYYSTLFEDIKDGSSRFIMGERGIGKTALMMSIEADLRDDNVFSVIIDEYDNIPTKNNEIELLNKIIRDIVTKLGVYLLNNKGILRHVKKKDKEKLSYFFVNFFETISEEEFKEISNTISKKEQKKTLSKIFNLFLLGPVNIVLSGASGFISDTICKSLGLPKAPEDFYKKYIPEIEIKDKEKVELSDLSYLNYKQLLRLLVETIRVLGFSSVVIFMDKIDEYQKLETNIKEIADFVKGIASDTSLLQMEKCAFVFVIWSKAREQLGNSGIRYDKFKPIDITWKNEELVTIINKRLHFFSDNEIKIEDLFEEKECLNEVMRLANKSPRQLLRLMSRVYDEQEADCCEVNLFATINIGRGLEQYAVNYDYLSMYPGEKGNKKYILSVINTMLKVGKKEFGSSDLVSAKKYSVQAANNDIKVMRNYGLIKEIRGSAGNTKRYTIQDPIICYLIDKHLTLIS